MRARALHAPDTVVWHNTDGVEQTAEENLAVLQWVIDNPRRARYDDVKWLTFDDGFVQQHVLQFLHRHHRGRDDHPGRGVP